MNAHSVAAHHAGAFGRRSLDELGIDRGVDDIGSPMRWLERGHRDRIAGKSAHAYLRRVDDSVGGRDFALEITRYPAARRPKMLCQILAKRVRTNAITVMHDENRNAKIHQGKCDRVSGTSGSDLHYRRTLGTLSAEIFFKTVPPSAPIEVVARGPAIRRNCHSIDRANLGSFLVDSIQERKNLLLERICDVWARKTGDPDRLEEPRQSSLPQAVDIQQMIETVDSGGRECVGKQRRRQRPHDVRANQSEQHPGPAHDTRSACASPPPRKSCAMRGSARIFGAESSIRVCPCSSTRP